MTNENKMNPDTDEKDNWPWTWHRDPVNAAAPSWMKKVEKANEFLALCGSGYEIDEIALQFESRHLLNSWLREAVKGEGVEIFNAASDHVHVEPFRTHYDVDYTFLRASSMPGVRIEAMILESGVSPLHTAQASMDPDVCHGQMPVVVHMSFKVRDIVSYGLAMLEMQEMGGILGQACESDYGRFAYWKFPVQMNGQFGGIWIKPRVNLREAAERDRDKDEARGIKPGEVFSVINGGDLSGGLI